MHVSADLRVEDVEGGSVEGSFDCWLIAVPD